ncbi:MAG TPA: hypothetical protein VGS17_14025 [Candidatus Limnocylindria bacterium]|nr:hypothetical protein [Candidatus Limnocylindria bacterium]
MRMDRIIVAAFVVLVSTAIVGFSTGNTGASFTGTTTNPNQSWNTQNVTPPASFTSATSAIAGRIDLVWTATTSPAGSHTLTYLVLRGPVGGPYVQVGTTAGLTYSDTPGADGTYEYVIQTKIAQGAGFFTSGNSAVKSNKSDRTAPVMSATCNGGSCAGWFNGSVTFVVSGNDGAGVGMGTATTNVDAGGAITSAAPRTVTVSGESATHSVVYSGADAVGNASGNTSQTVKIDLTTPTTAGAFTVNLGQQNGEADLTWTAGTDALSGVAGYLIRRATATTCPAATAANYPTNLTVGAVTAYTWTGLTSGTSYCFYIQTKDNAGNLSAASALAGPIVPQ